MDNKQISKAITNALRHLKEKGVSQKQVSKKINLSETNLSKAKNFDTYEYFNVAGLSRRKILDRILDSYYLAIDSSSLTVFSNSGLSDLMQGVEIRYAMYRIVDGNERVGVSLVTFKNQNEVIIEIKGEYDDLASLWKGEIRRSGTNLFLEVKKENEAESGNYVKGLYCFYYGNSELTQKILQGTYSRVTRNGTPVAGRVVLVLLAGDQTFENVKNKIPDMIKFLLKGSHIQTSLTIPADISTLEIEESIKPLVGDYLYYSLGKGDSNTKDFIRKGIFTITPYQKAILTIRNLEYEGWIYVNLWPTFEFKLNLTKKGANLFGTSTYILLNMSKYGRQKTFIPGISLTTNDDNLPYASPILLSPNIPAHANIEKIDELANRFFANQMDRITCPSFSRIDEITNSKD